MCQRCARLRVRAGRLTCRWYPPQALRKPLSAQIRGMKRSLALAGAGGVAVTLSLPPVHLWWMGPIGVALLLEGVMGTPLRTRAISGVVFAIGWMGPGLFWVSEFHVVGFAVLVMLESGLIAVGILGIQERRMMAVVPAVMVFIEVLRTALPFGGLPLAGIALGQTNGPLLPIAGVVGNLGVAAATAALGTAIVGWRRGQKGPAVCGAVAVGALAFGGFGSIGVTNKANSITVAAVQGGGPRGIRAINADPEKVYQRHIAASARIPDNGADIVLWPEDVLAISGPIQHSQQRFELARLARRVDGELLVGVVEDDGARFHNAAIGWDAFGRLAHRYEKYHRVPFGEYVPLRGLLKHVTDLSVLPRDAYVGKKANVLQFERAKAGVLISFEVFFENRGRTASLDNAELLLVPTNASSYRGSAVPAQEVAAAQLRAVETSRWVVQAAPTGYSAFVSPEGKVVAQTKLGAQEVLIRKVRLRKGNTPYTVEGSTPLVILATLSFLWATLIGRKRPTD